MPVTASSPPDAALDLFHPIVREWFAERVGTPTDVQRRAWPEIAAGRHVLVTAPTGTGKTLTAFLWAIDRLLTGALAPGALRVLYVSPLKALNTDVRRNLLDPLAELAERFRAAGEDVPEIRVVTRSGDTPQTERQKMIRRPPEILITTPETLNILLTSQGGRSILDGLATVILDEIHAVAGTKRGTHLITAIERLVPLSGEIQRVALSATVRPLATVAAFVGGFELLGGGGGAGRGAAEAAVYRPRPISVVRSSDAKVYDLAVRFPGDGDPSAPAAIEDPESSIWDLLAPELRRSIRRNRSTLVFANSRRLTEKLTRLINAEESPELAYSHHGSLSREVRAVVEERLKAGLLPAIVATNSLELGIDIGALDEVALVQTPPSVASAVQRVGRAGHRVGEVSRGTLWPTHGRDVVEAAVVARAILDGEIEDVRPVEAPLDVLAQVILSMTAAEPRGIEELLAHLRAMWPYRNLSRRHYELVLDMLAGRYADSRVRELSARVTVDRVEGTIRARPGAARLIYMSGGTIPDRGYFHLRVEGRGGADVEVVPVAGRAGGTAAAGGKGAAGAAGLGPKIGELDEEFVWERSPGDTFTLGTQIWRIRRITHNDVIVERARGSAAMAPFWRADERDRGAFLSERVGRFLQAMEPRLEAPDEELLAYLHREHVMDRGAGAELVRFLRAQKAAMGGRLPHRHRLVIEHVGAPESGEPSRPEDPDRRRVVLHTFWGGRVNRPLAIALAAAWEERYGLAPEILHDDDCLMLTLPAELAGEDLLALVPPERIEELLRRRLEQTGFFGALFRQNASRALLLPRAGFRQRMPLWVTRQRSKRLLDAVGRYGDFPLVLETWRTCLEDELDLPALEGFLDEVRSGVIEVRRVATEAPSPFAANLLWKQTNTLMYADDSADGGRGPALSADLLRELVFSSSLRPRIPVRVAGELAAKLQRVAPGYAPRDAGELLHWLRERLLVPADEWRELLAAVRRGVSEGTAEPSGEEPADPLAPWLVELAARAVWMMPRGARLPSVAALETVPRLQAALAADGGDGEGDGDEGPALHLAALGDPAAPPPAAALENLVLLERAAAEAPHAADTAGEAAAETAEDGAAGESDPLTELLGEWLRFYGPVEPARLAAIFGLAEAGTPLALAIEDLVEEDRVVVDQITEGAESPEVVDAQNLETLLRWTRAAARPEFEALALARLPLFLASHQGVAAPGDSLEDLQERLESLLGYPAPARAWEAEILPARLDPYRTPWLDTLLRETGLVWVGTGPRRLAFAFPSDLELLGDAAATPEPETAADGNGAGGDTPPRSGASLFPHLYGRYTPEDLAATSGSDRRAVIAALWELAWRGRATTDGFDPVRRAALRRFRLAAAPEAADAGAPLRVAGAPAALGRRSRLRPRLTRPLGRGASAPPEIWRPLLAAGQGGPAEDAQPLDALDREELAKDRARLVLERYGVVFRELLARELPAFGWGKLFRALRLMELSGEVLAGQFFLGVPGLQFASHAAFRRLREGLLPDDAVFWLAVQDPASLAGVDLPELKAALPERRDGNHVVFHGEAPVVISRRRGKSLEIRVTPEHPRLPDYLGFLKHQLTRDFAPRKAITVEEINGAPAPASPYRDLLRELFSATVEYKSIKLRRRY